MQRLQREGRRQALQACRSPQNSQARCRPQPRGTALWWPVSVLQQRTSWLCSPQFAFGHPGLIARVCRNCFDIEFYLRWAQRMQRDYGVDQLFLATDSPSYLEMVKTWPGFRVMSLTMPRVEHHKRGHWGFNGLSGEGQQVRRQSHLQPPEFSGSRCRWGGSGRRTQGGGSSGRAGCSLPIGAFPAATDAHREQGYAVQAVR